MAYKVSGSIQEPMSITVLNSDGISQKTQSFGAGAWEINGLTCPSGTIIGFEEDDTFKGFGHVPFIEYDARPSVPWTDPFSGMLDSNMWQYWSGTSPSWFVNSGKNRSSVNSAGRTSGISSKFTIQNDFDIEVGYTIIVGPTTAYWEFNFQLDFPPFGNYSECMVRIARMCSSTPSQRYMFESFNGMPIAANASATGNITGKLRLVRSGSVFSSYYWNGSSWTQLGANQDFGTMAGIYPLILHIYTSTYTNYPSVIVQYDYFKINSGTIGYRFVDRCAYPVNYTAPNKDVYTAAPGSAVLPYTYNNKLRFDMNSTRTIMAVDMKEKLVGNFDISVDCNILNVPDSEFWQFKLQVFNNDSTYKMNIGRYFTGSTGHCFRTETLVASVSNVYEVANTATVVSFRIRRYGTTVYTYYKASQDTSAAWTLHRTTNGFTSGDLTCRFYGGILNSATYASADIDNLLINNASNINTKLLVDIPPNIPTYIPEPSTSLLLHFDEATLIDSSYNKYPLTLNGGVTGVDLQSKLGDSAGSFYGSQYITIANSADFDFGSGDFTVDFWARPTNTTNGAFIALSQDTVTSYSALRIQYNSTQAIGLLMTKTNGVWELNTTTAASSAPLNTWSHIALVRSGTTIKLYINGVAAYTNSSFSGSLMSAAGNYIGTIVYPAVPCYYTGYIDELRISKGIARWTSDFTPPTSEYSTDSYTKLLLHMNNSLVDSSGNNNTVTNNGVGIANNKFNKVCCFDGVDDYVSIIDSEDWNFGSGNFTIDFWINWSSIPGAAFCGQSAGGGNTLKWGIYYKEIVAGNLTIHMHNPAETAIDINWTWSPSSFTWYHIAIVRNGNIWTAYVNGNSLGDVTNSISIANISTDLRVGADGENWKYFNGYMDEFRISKGIARWTDNFTPPTSAYSS